MGFFPKAFGKSSTGFVATVFRELMHGSGNEFGAPNHDRVATHREPIDSSDLPYGCEKLCFEVGGGTKSACK